jgi:ABC-type nitrate/sulfonate/bicarbonate transport system substrate-binding protein
MKWHMKLKFKPIKKIKVPCDDKLTTTEAIMFKHKFLTKVFIVSTIAVGILLVAGNVQKAQAEDVTYLLPAPPFLPAFAPWMLAKARGYYKDEGLNVKFQTARGGVDVAKQVGAGNAVIGGGLGDTPVIVRPNGIPVKAVAVLVISKEKPLPRCPSRIRPSMRFLACLPVKV